jgi:hypothetical protein
MAHLLNRRLKAVWTREAEVDIRAHIQETAVQNLSIAIERKPWLIELGDLSETFYQVNFDKKVKDINWKSEGF